MNWGALGVKWTKLGCIGFEFEWIRVNWGQLRWIWANFGGNRARSLLGTTDKAVQTEHFRLKSFSDIKTVFCYLVSLVCRKLQNCVCGGEGEVAKVWLNRRCNSFKYSLINCDWNSIQVSKYGQFSNLERSNFTSFRKIQVQSPKTKFGGSKLSPQLYGGHKEIYKKGPEMDW